MTGLRTLGRQTLVYGLSGAAPQIVGLLTLPIIARVLTTSDYGVLELALVGVGLIGIFADLGLASASQRSFFDFTDEQQTERRRVLTTTLVTMTLSCCILGGLTFALRVPIARALFGSSSQAAVVGWMAALLVVGQLAVFAREVLRLHFWTRAYLVSSILAAVLGGIVSVIGVAVLDGGPEAMLAGSVLGAAAAATYGLIRARGSYVGRFSNIELRRMLSYGIPLVPTALSVWALMLIDRVLLNRLGTLSQVGEYAMANRLASVLLLAVTAFTIAFSPFALDLRTRDPEHERAVRAQALTAVVATLALLSASISIFARELLRVLAPQFEGAANTVGLLCLGTLLYGIASVVMLEISIARRTHIFAVYSLMAAAVNVAINLVLIPPLGIAGAGIATVAAFLLLAVAYWWHAQKIAFTPYDTRLVTELVLASTAVGALGLLPIGPGYFVIKLAGVAMLSWFLVNRELLRPRVIRMIFDAAGVSPRAQPDPDRSTDPP